MIAIVCGGRDYSRANRVAQVLDAAVERLGLWCIIQGEATGADALAKEWAKSRGMSMISVPPDDDWPSAGPRRNRIMRSILMGDGGGDKAVFAFGGGKGTANMLAQAREFPEIRIIEIDR